MPVSTRVAARWPSRAALVVVDVGALAGEAVGRIAVPRGRDAVDHPSGDGRLRRTVDEDERAGGRLADVGVEDVLALDVEVDAHDVVEADALRGALVERVHVERVQDAADLDARRAGVRTEQEPSRGGQRCGVEPDERGIEPVGAQRSCPAIRAGSDEQIAAGEVELVGERERDRVARARVGPVAVEGDDALDAAAHAGRQRLDLVADAERARGQRPRVAAERRVGADDELDGEAHRALRSQVDHLGCEGLELGEQRRSVPPADPRGRRHDVVAVTGAHRDDIDLVRGQAEARGDRAAVGGDACEDVAVEADEVELVDREHDVADAEQRDDGGVPTGLRQHALARIDEHDRGVAAGRAGRHVAGVLHVAGGVGDEDASGRGREHPPGDVDGDALLPLRGQPVGQQREVEVPAGRAVHLGVGGERDELVLEDLAGVMEQAADQGRLPVVDAAADEQAEDRRLGRRHQK
jgi:hypothetical protein